MASFRTDAANQVAEANAALGAAKERIAALESSLDAAQESQMRSESALRERDNALAAECAKSEALEKQLRANMDAQARQDQALADARRDFAAELEKQRAALALSEERLRAAERHALLEIDKGSSQKTEKIVR